MHDPDALLSAFMRDIFAPIEPGDVDGAGELPPHPVQEFLAKAAQPESVDPMWLQPVGTVPAVELSKSFLKRSDARLERVSQKIRANPLFAEHTEELEEALRIARELRDTAREEVLIAR
jgi:hypothetical protein